MNGNSDTIAYEGVQCAGNYSLINGNIARLYSPPINIFNTTQIYLNFWYQCPSNNELSDELNVYYKEFSDWILLAGPFTATDEWTNIELFLNDLSSEFQLAFVGLSNGGNGIFIDSIFIGDNSSTIQEYSENTSHFINYPNPFNKFTNISFNNKTTGHVKLTVYDIYGKKIKELTNNIISKGYHTFQFNTNDIPSGIYYIILNTTEGKFVKKAVKKR